jgi:cobyrinic acid a,c-diamide synthase
MQSDGMGFPRIVISALRGGSGKTLLSIGIIAALRKLGYTIAPFKKGPDYIDAGWLALAAGRPCYNLDSFLLNRNDIFQSFLTHTINRDISLIEGNRGLYDGIDLEGSTSTAELAKLLKCPVVLCVDCTKITRTMAAVVMGCTQFDADVMIKAVVLNRVANARHEKKLRDNIEHYCDIPVLGAIPKLGEQHFPERHLGLVPTAEHDWAKDSVDAVIDIAEKYIDLHSIAEIARHAPDLDTKAKGPRPEAPSSLYLHRRHTHNELESGIYNAKLDVFQPATKVQQSEADIKKLNVKIGVIKDSAFQFYYPENIDALCAKGAEVIFVSPLTDKNLPQLDALYIGGGFPETHAGQLAGNKSFSGQIKDLAGDGFPIYAECGGLMYLGEKLVLEGQTYPMAGIFPVVFDFYKRPQGHGYTIVKVEHENPYYAVGTEIRGHEFHYSRVSEWAGDKKDLVFHMERGVGIDKDRDGIVYKNVLATYTHVHAIGTPAWAEALVRNAIKFNNSRK